MARKRSRLTLDDLPDCILPIILSKIPFKEAVHCSLVSKGWKFCWTFAKNLKFPEDFFSSSRSPTEIQNIIDLIFERHSGQLEVFEFNNVRFCCSSDKISDWIHCAALKTDLFRRDDEAILPLENLKWVHLNITYFHHPVSLLSCLFRIARALKTLLISRKKGFNGVSAQEFINLAWNLQRPSTETKVFLSRCTAKEKICVDCDLVNFI
ncbi:hypothetical protein SUGI_0352920 [Cryptomeria japonica]|uniref:uncharacterized protein LOC131874901 n=1 Tax=Cryptomeria japonica TaxID=3369 RepID=UPI002408C34A|nr:uncharacterized protein LOC131874901 [Cryptomeria japonica]GLJ19542.1 hypothetical protein SUGI_0352920 [Cryptomeria japonica]